MQPVAALPSFLAATPAAAPARPRLFDVPPPTMARDAYRPPVHPAAPMPVAPAQPPISANQQAGQATLTTLTAGLGVAGVFAPPVLPFAGALGLVQALDTQIGNPIAKTVGTVVNGVVDAGKSVGNFFGKLFGG